MHVNDGTCWTKKREEKRKEVVEIATCGRERINSLVKFEFVMEELSARKTKTAPPPSPRPHAT
jgi:hypothetical protein